MKTVRTIPQMQTLAENLRREGKRIGFVPTMGYLHEGHLSLMRLARPKCDILVVSIFVNPTQFGPNEDFEQYPRDMQRDERLCQQEQVDVIFYPDVNEMYHPDHLTFVTVEQLSQTMCGISRPSHFRGVATVVSKLFNIVKPHFAVFGQKDYQQALIIRRMVRDLNFDLEIITAPIVREADGLAMSSRNTYLSPEERKQAVVLYQSLRLAQQLAEQGERNANAIYRKIESLITSKPLAKIDYIAIVDGETLQPVRELTDNTLVALAVKFGNTRLIDNMVIRLKAKI